MFFGAEHEISYQYTSTIMSFLSSGAVTRASDSRLRELRFESCAVVSNLGQIHSFYIVPVLSSV